jgi:hypothetical protein
MLTADKNVFPDPGRGAVVSHAPPTSCVLQDCWLELIWMKESGGVGETGEPLMVTTELVKLTVPAGPGNLGLKTALSQITSPGGTD